MNSVRKKQLKAKAHALKPVIIIGQSGLTEAVTKEMELALDNHELIKIKIRAEKADRIRMTGQIIERTGADLIQTIGQICIIYRKNPDK